MIMKRAFYFLTPLLIAAAVLIGAVPAARAFTELITPNTLTIVWEDAGKPETTIDAYRIRGSNVAQLRELLNALDLEIKSAEDDPKNRKTRVVIRQKTAAENTYGGRIAWEKNRWLAISFVGYESEVTADTVERIKRLCKIPEDRVLKAEGDEVYLIAPRYPSDEIIVDHLIDPMLQFEESNLKPFYNGTGAILLYCNPSDLYSNVRVAVRRGVSEIEFSPAVSLKDGKLILPALSQEFPK